MHRNEIASNIEKIVFFYKREQYHTFFYMNNIIIASKLNQRDNVDVYVRQLIKMFEIRNLNIMKFFFEIRIICEKKTVFIIQNIYMKKLIKKYKINLINMKTLVISISVNLKAFDNKINIANTHQYKKIIELIYYSTVCIRFNIIKIVSKFLEFFINSRLNHIKAAMQCLCYLYVTKSLEI